MVFFFQMRFFTKKHPIKQYRDRNLKFKKLQFKYP